MWKDVFTARERGVLALLVLLAAVLAGASWWAQRALVAPPGSAIEFVVAEAPNAIPLPQGGVYY